MTNSMVVFDAEQFETMQRVAKVMVASGYFRDSQDIAQAVVKIMAGQELGLLPFASMSGIHIIKGKPTLGATPLATLVKNHPDYDYRVLEISNEVCKIKFFEHGEECGVSTFTVQDAQKAGTQNMGKFARNMLFARSISNGVKWFVPGVFGGAPVYTPEELGATVDEEGDIIIDVTPEPAKINYKREAEQLAVVVDHEPEEMEPEIEEAQVTEIQKTPERQEPAIQVDEAKDVAEELGAEVAWEGKDEFTEEPKPKPLRLTDGEQVIYESGTENYVKTLIALIDRYDNAEAIKNALKKLGQTGWPRGTDNAAAMRRVKQYRAVRDYAKKRDAEEATQEPMFKEGTS